MSVRMRIKQGRWQRGPWQLVFKIVWRLYNMWQFITLPRYRSRIIASLRYAANYHQFSTFTLLNRYPDLFTIAQTQLADKPDVRLLSFGCSTGEEAATLRTYLPQAHIIGVDINPWCVRTATQHYSSISMQFFHSLSREFSAVADFDAIFCLAVFQHPANRHDTERTQSAYSFDRFEQQLLLLSEKLKPGGLLFIDQCDFNFFETSAFTKYQLANVPNNMIQRQRPIFNRNGQKVADKQLSFRVFQKK